MPGLSGRIGGDLRQDAAAVTGLMNHFPFYGAASVGDDRAWLGWTGVGDPGTRLDGEGPAAVLVGYHGDGAADPAASAVRLEQVRRLAATAPLGLAEACDGSFAAARYDTASGELTLVTDPFGHKRLYYLQRGDALYFAPELKGFLGWPGLEMEPDPAALCDVLNYTYPLGDRTSLAGVRLLPPASVLRFARGELKVETYWRPAYEPQDAQEGELAARGYELFARAFRDKVGPQRPTMVPVSGGIDSRMLLGEALRRGQPVRAYTYGHGASREARVAMKVMAAAGVGDRFITLDEFPEPDQALLRGSWFVEGMANLTVSALVGVNHHLLDEPRDAVFLNGIYGGPTNFSNAYHRPEELVEGLGLEDKVRRVGRTIFSGQLDTPGARVILQPDFAARCAGAYGRELTAAFAPWQDVSPLFGHQKDAFLVANRLCRFMNQVDLNRYYWDCAIPLTSFGLYRFYLQLPEAVKHGRRLHRRILAEQFPVMANVVNFNSGRTIVEELAGIPPRVRSQRGIRLRHLLGRLSRGRLSTPDPESYQAPDHYLRRNRPMRDFVGDVLEDPGFLSDDVFDRRQVREDFARTLRGANLGSRVLKVLSWELWCRQVKAGRREAT